MTNPNGEMQTSDYIFRVVAILITWLILAVVVHLAFVYIAPWPEGQHPPAFWENYALVAILWTGMRWWRNRKLRRASAGESRKRDEK